MKYFLFITALILSIQTLMAKPKINQTAVIVAGSVVNLVKLPSEPIYFLKKHLAKKKLEKIKKINPNIQNQNYCEEKCPSDYTLFQNTLDRIDPDNDDNLLAFLNEKKDFANHIQRNVGYCWGHSTITRNINYLAYFDPFSSFEKAPNPKDQKAFIKFYRKKINKIARGKAVIIPGFKNIYEFSSHKEIQKILKTKVVWSWANNALKARSIPYSFMGKKGKMSTAKMENFISKIEEKLSINHMPKIIFTNLEKPAFIHVVNVFKVNKVGQEIRLCLLDNHQYSDELKDCGVFVSVDLQNQSYFYSGWENPDRELKGHVGQFRFSPEDDIEYVKYHKSVRNLCLSTCAKNQNFTSLDEL